jgi:hypothetical protein
MKTSSPNSDVGKGEVDKLGWCALRKLRALAYRWDQVGGMEGGRNPAAAPDARQSKTGTLPVEIVGGFPLCVLQ